jgi:membrane-associated phospholipid phosphatase
MFSSGRTLRRRDQAVRAAAPATSSAAPRRAGRPRAATVWWLLGFAVGLLAVLLCAGWALARWATGTDLGAADAALTRWLVAQREPTLDDVSLVVSFAAETLTVTVLGLLAAGGMWLAWRRWREPLTLAVALIGEVLIFLATTALVDRERPSVVKLDEAPPTSSFPSGHVAASIALYGTLALIAWHRLRPGALRKLLVTVAVVLPLAIGVARVYRGMHYVSDVIGGILLGATWLWATLRATWQGAATAARRRTPWPRKRTRYG